MLVPWTVTTVEFVDLLTDELEHINKYEVLALEED